MELIVCVTLANSVLFMREQRSAVLMSNLGILFMGFVLKWGALDGVHRPSSNTTLCLGFASITGLS